jgi:serine/tyrosine/threonine adenylyltransferase
MTIQDLSYTYSNLPQQFFSHQEPIPVKSPEMLLFNHKLVEQLGIDDLQINDWLKICSGNQIIPNSKPLAQAYAGHQFGNFTMLGDGRAILLGETRGKDGLLYDIQLKGSGRTPFSRGGDGRATVKAMLREYLVSEAMHGLGISTSRSLAVVKTGEQVYREKNYDGAILTRVAKSHLRVGTFEYAYQFTTLEDQKALTKYAIERHYPELRNADNPALELLKAVQQQQINLIVDWMRVGFIHGVMNTDNMTISGETIDYGPCAFMNTYNPETVFSSIDTTGRYAYGNQPKIAQWNLSRLAIALINQIDEDQDKAVQMAQDVINSFPHSYQKEYLQKMRNKLGWLGEEQGDKLLIDDLLHMMQRFLADYTNTFLGIASGEFQNESIFESLEYQDWYMNWLKRASLNARPLEEAIQQMSQYNPQFIPRNDKVEAALDAAAEANDFSLFYQLLEIVQDPYRPKTGFTAYQFPPINGDEGYQTFCGT